MLRSLASVLVVATLFGWLQPEHDASFRAGMVPVTVPDTGKTILVAPFEVTMGDWTKCYADKGCSFMPKARSSNPALPVTGVNWFDVNEYLTWANAKAGGGLRLPTKEEWRYLNRTLEKPKAPPAFTDPRLAWAADYGSETPATGPVLPRGSFSKTAEGISDLDGNVWEWTMSCAQTLPGDTDRCPAYFAEGAHESALSVFIRNPAEGGCATGSPPTHVGFRLVAETDG